MCARQNIYPCVFEYDECVYLVVCSRRRSNLSQAAKELQVLCATTQAYMTAVGRPTIDFGAALSGCTCSQLQKNYLGQSLFS